MLRVLSARGINAVSFCSKELCLLNYCRTQNLTLAHNVPRKTQLPVLRSLSTSVKETNDNNIDVIYKGRLEKDIFRVKIFSMTTSVLGLVFQPILYSQASSLPVVIATGTIVGFFTFVTPILLHQLAKRHVNTITYNKEKDSYTAFTTTFFFQEKRIAIEPGEAKVPEMSGIFTSLEVRGIPLMVEMEGFDKHHLIRLLGYDKPLDIKHEQLAEAIQQADQEKVQKKRPNLLPGEESKQRSSNRA